jgi:hypothetical protein
VSKSHYAILRLLTRSAHPKRDGEMQTPPAASAPIYVLTASAEWRFVTGGIDGVTGGNPFS